MLLSIYFDKGLEDADKELVLVSLRHLEGRLTVAIAELDGLVGARAPQQLPQELIKAEPGGKVDQSRKLFLAWT